MSKIGGSVLKKKSYKEYYRIPDTVRFGVKTESLDSKTVSNLRRIFEGEIHYNPEDWNAKAIEIVRDALRRRTLITNPEDLHIGVPISDAGVGFEHYYTLLSYDGIIPLAVEIPKRDIEKGRFSMAAYCIRTN